MTLTIPEIVGSILVGLLVGSIVGILTGVSHYYINKFKELKSENSTLKDNIEILQEQVYAKFEEEQNDD